MIQKKSKTFEERLGIENIKEIKTYKKQDWNTMYSEEKIM